MTVEEEAAAKQVEADKAKKAEEDAAKAKAAQGDEAKGTVPKAEYDKLQADLANFKRIEEERKGKEKKRQEELLAEQGKFKELYETAQRENVAMKTRLEAQDAVFKTMLGDELKDLPEDFDKTLIPAGESYDQLVWVRKARPMMVPKAGTSRAGDGTPPPAKPGDLAHGMRGIYTHPTSPKH
jgi:hypothetical protein